MGERATIFKCTHVKQKLTDMLVAFAKNAHAGTVIQVCQKAGSGLAFKAISFHRKSIHLFG